MGRCFETPSEDSRCVFGWLSRTGKEESGHKRKAVGDSGSSRIELDTTAGKATKFNSTSTPDARDPNVLYDYVDEIHSLNISGAIIWNAVEIGKDAGFKTWMLNLPGFGRKQVWCKITTIKPQDLINFDFKKSANCLSYHYSPTSKTGNLYNPDLYDDDPNE